MKIKKFIAAMAATAVSVSAMAVMAISAYAEDVDIPYTASDNALATSDDNNEIRLNICNTDEDNSISDIESDTHVSEKIVVNFTVDGIGSDSTRTNEDGTTEDLCAYLIGSAGNNSAWSSDESGNEPVTIYGDGDYTATWNLDEAAASIDSLILQSNIKLPDGKTLEESGITLSVNYISTVSDESASTTATSSADSSADSSATTTASDTVTSSTAAAAAADSAATTSVAPIANAPAPTGDVGVGAVVSVMALAGAAVVFAKKKDN